MDRLPGLTLRIEMLADALRAAVVDPHRPEPIIRHEHPPDAPAPAIRDLLRESPGRIERVELHVPFDVGRHGLLARTCVGAVLVGFPISTAERVRAAARLRVTGDMDADGRELRPLDLGPVPGQVRRLVADHGLQALAVGGIHSTLNPDHERRAAAAARAASGLPVIEGRYFRTEAGAIDRADAAARTAAWLLAVRAAGRCVRAATSAAGLEVRLHVGGAGPAMTAAVVAAAPIGFLADLDAALDAVELRTEARVSRVSKGRYRCHCDDGCFEFDSLSAAKTFGERHLREQLVRLAREAAILEPAVKVEINDRYGRGRGRQGAMRVFLEAIIIARVIPGPGA